MLDTVIYLLSPITIAFLTSGILSYYGNHILSRGIIFIDIAVAQVAALGTMLGMVLGYDEASPEVKIISYACTMGVLAVFSLSKTEKPRLSQEAVIGIMYCVTLGLALLFADKIVGGSNYIAKTITGNILWVTWKQVMICAILFLIIFIFELVFGQNMREISLSEGIHVRGRRYNKVYDLIFYLTFGIVVVNTVPILGIFLVFILLIGPAVVITLFTTNWKKRIFWSWGLGFMCSVLGILLSYVFNISNGPTIVCILGVLGLVMCVGIILAKSN